MDTGLFIWGRSEDQVEEYAHLEYESGTMVFNSAGNVLEVWKTGQDGCSRGEFRRTAVLPHQCNIRGFQLSYNTLCVVSAEGEGFVYDMNTTTPRLRTHLAVADGVVGHLDQDDEVVMYSLGEKGYHIHDKTSGKLLGVMEPWHCMARYHIDHSVNTDLHVDLLGYFGSARRMFPPREARRDRLDTLHIKPGPGSPRQSNLRPEEWGAGVLSGCLMVGISNYGRVIVCRDWRRAIKGPEELKATASMVECEDDGGRNFERGGWLSVRDNRVMFEIVNRIYVIALESDGNIIVSAEKATRSRSSFCLPKGSAQQFEVPVSFMALYDDCIISIYGVSQRYQVHALEY